MSAAQTRVAAKVRSGPRGVLRGPVQAWLHSPCLAERAQELGAHCRFGSTLTPDLSELAILLTAAFWRSGYEWVGHVPAAEEAGLARKTILAILAAQRPEGLRPAAVAVFDFVTQLLRSGRVSDTAFQSILIEIGSVGVVDLIGIVGYYGLVAMTANALEITPIGDAPDPFAGKPDQEAERK